MSDAPETITAWGDRTRLGVVLRAGPRPMKAMAAFDPTAYRRADLPATNAQAMANPKVTFAKECLERIADLTQHNMSMTARDEQVVYRQARAALAALEADT